MIMPVGRKNCTKMFLIAPLVYFYVGWVVKFGVAEFTVTEKAASCTFLGYGLRWPLRLRDLVSKKRSRGLTI